MSRASPVYCRGVQFTSGMIGIHAQAITMFAVAASHGASPGGAVRSRRRIIVVADRRDQVHGDWLRARNQVVPPADARGYVMPGMSGPMLTRS